MADIVQLTPERHGGKYWQRFKLYGFAARTQFASLVAGELPKAVLNMPLCFVYKENQYHLTALLSPEPGDNYFLSHDFKWLGGYVPAYFRGHPFSMSDIQGRRLLCVDEDSGLISNTDGEPFFDQKGGLSKAVTEVKTFLEEVDKSRIKTDIAVSALADAGLIVKWPLSVTIGGKEMHVPDLYKTDEAGLNQADDQTFLKLRRAGALPMAYAQLLSMGNVRLFHKLAEMRAQSQKQPKVDLDKLLGEDDIFKF